MMQKWSIFHPSPPWNPLWSLVIRRSPTHPFQWPHHPDLFQNPLDSSAPSFPSKLKPFIARTSTKITPAPLVHEMQGSITTLVMAVRESGATDPVAKLQQEAVMPSQFEKTAFHPSKKSPSLKYSARTMHQSRLTYPSLNMMSYGSHGWWSSWVLSSYYLHMQISFYTVTIHCMTACIALRCPKNSNSFTRCYPLTHPPHHWYPSPDEPQDNPPTSPEQCGPILLVVYQQ